MKAILLGTDFMYNKNGDLVPIQINTALGHNMFDRVEDDDYIFDLSLLKELIIKNDFETIFYIGNIIPFKNRFSNLCMELDKSLSFFKLSQPSLTVPLIKDSDKVLIVRSAYDTSAIIDDSYCRNRGQFLEFIKDMYFGSEFAYINSEDKLVNNIKTIPDNGKYPNFILKSVFPDYDRKLYPKLLKIEDDIQLKNIIDNLTSSYFLMPFYYNSEKLYNNHIVNIRSLNILFLPDLKSIPIGAYTKITEKEISEYRPEFREPFLTTDDINVDIFEKEYLNEKIIKPSEILKMNDILTIIGNKIIKEYS